jgi:hypothetical protein
LFLAGLVLGAGAVRLAGQAPMPAPAAPLETLAVAGFAVGLGTRIGNGCTSGHGVCGIARLSPRSLAATVTFLTSGMITVFIVRHVLGGWR